jgi:hypothetical protein
MKINCGPTESEKLDIAQRVCREMEKNGFPGLHGFQFGLRMEIVDG